LKLLAAVRFSNAEKFQTKKHLLYPEIGAQSAASCNCRGLSNRLTKIDREKNIHRSSDSFSNSDLTDPSHCKIQEEENINIIIIIIIKIEVNVTSSYKIGRARYRQRKNVTAKSHKIF
jgi:hypothetical protein